MCGPALWIALVWLSSSLLRVNVWSFLSGWHPRYVVPGRYLPALVCPITAIVSLLTCTWLFVSHCCSMVPESQIRELARKSSGLMSEKGQEDLVGIVALHLGGAGNRGENHPGV